MNLYQTIRTNYGQSTVKILRNCDKIERKISSFRNHRVFTLRCRDQSLTPPSLRLKCNINTDNARKIIRNAEKQLVRERIRVIGNKLDFLQRKRSKINDDLNSRGLPDDVNKSITEHLAQSREKTFQDVRSRQIRKYDRLVEKQSKKASNRLNRCDTIDLTGSQLKKWVVNLSKFKVNNSQTKVLSRGLNFAVSPDDLKDPSVVNEYITACEKACWKLSASESAQLRSEIVGTLKSAKPPKSNITKEERQAIKQLQKEKSIQILAADKGRATVIMDTEEYNNKLQSMPSDTDTYTQLKKDPTTKYKTKLVNILARLKKEGKIRPEDKTFLYPTAEIVPRIYGSPKIHKDGNPLRPIIDYTGTIGYNVSRSLADIQ